MTTDENELDKMGNNEEVTSTKPKRYDYSVPQELEANIDVLRQDLGHPHNGHTISFAVLALKHLVKHMDSDGNVLVANPNNPFGSVTLKLK